MNTRQAIQPPSTPAVLTVSFSQSRNRFIVGLSSGLKVFRSDNCLTTFHGSTTKLDSPFAGGIAIADALGDRYIAFVSGGRGSAGKDSTVVFWDCVLDQEVQRLEFGEQIKGVRVCGKWLAVVLLERTVVFAYQELHKQASPRPQNDSEEDLRTEKSETTGDEILRAPNRIHSLHQTASNPFALACLQNARLVLPAQSTGQVQIVPLPSGSKRVLRAHNTALRCIALTPSGNLLATTSEQGTLIRVFDTTTLDQVAEFRRGVEKAVVFGLAFSPLQRWLACTSDKGTVHIFDLCPPPSQSDLPTATPPSTSHRASQTGQQHRKTASHPPSHRLSIGSRPGVPESLSAFSGRSSPTTATATNTVYQGSIQEYYGLRPPPVGPSSPPAVASAMTAFKHSSWAPKVLKDVRSIASLPFHVGDEPTYWQGGASHSWTTAPGGTKKRVRNPVVTLPGEPSGRPPKGVIAFADLKDLQEGEDRAVLYVVGGGTDARWELYDILPRENGGWAMQKRGWRRYLTRQFVD